MSGDNGWFQQNCDPNDDPNAGQQEVPSGGGPVNTGADGTTPAEKTVNQVIENPAWTVLSIYSTSDDQELCP